MTTIEGLETQSQKYKPYNLNNPNNTLILAQQNAGNIQVLKKQMDDVLDLNKEVKKTTKKVLSNKKSKEKLYQIPQL